MIYFFVSWTDQKRKEAKLLLLVKHIFRENIVAIIINTIVEVSMLILISNKNFIWANQTHYWELQFSFSLLSVVLSPCKSSSILFNSWSPIKTPNISLDIGWDDFHKNKIRIEVGQSLFNIRSGRRIFQWHRLLPQHPHQIFQHDHHRDRLLLFHWKYQKVFV